MHHRFQSSHLKNVTKKLLSGNKTQGQTGKIENNQEDGRFKFNAVKNYSKCMWKWSSNLETDIVKLDIKKQQPRPILSIRHPL